MSELTAEVCREHRDENCRVCDENNDDLWAHPRDLPPLHADCPLCNKSINDREDSIAELNRTIDLLHEEISEIERGMRHTDYHEAQRKLVTWGGEVVSERCPHCPHLVQGSPWWVGQQMPIHVSYAHPEHRAKT